MRTVYIEKSHDHGILGVATNKKAAHAMIVQFSGKIDDAPLSHSYGQLCSEMAKKGFAWVETKSSGTVEISPYDTNQYQPEC